MPKKFVASLCVIVVEDGSALFGLLLRSNSMLIALVMARYCYL
jgi:hypothetical protein